MSGNAVCPQAFAMLNETFSVIFQHCVLTDVDYYVS